MLALTRFSLLACAMALTLPAFAVEKKSQDDEKQRKTILSNPLSAAQSDTISVVGNWLDNTDNSTVVLEHPGARTIITQQRMQEKGAQTLTDSLRGIPGVQVQESNGTGGSDISLNVGVRGLTSRLSPRSTILMDGIPLAAAPYGQPQLSMAPLSMGNLQSIDVIRGGGAVRYGPQNVGGIINFNTKAIPQAFSGAASVQTQGARYGGLKTLTSTSLGGTAETGFGAVLLYSGLHGQGYRENNNNTDIDDVMLKTRYELSEHDELLANFRYYEAHAGMPGGLSSAEYAQNPFQSTRPFDQFEGRRRDMSFKYKHQKDDKQFELLTYFTKSFRGSNIEGMGTGKNRGIKQLIAYPRHYTTYAIEPSYSQLFRVGAASHEVTVGYRYLNETMDEKSYSSVWYNPAIQHTQPATPEYLKHTSGGTVAHALYIDDAINLGNWTITPGLRYEDIRTHVEHSFTNNTREKHYREPLPSINLMYHLSDEWKWFANANTSFGSMQYFQLSMGGEGNEAAEGLTAEKSRSYELGTRFDNTVITSELTLFYIDFDNQLQYSNDSKSWTNLGATKHQGAELAFSYDLSELHRALDGVSVYTSYTYTQATSKNGAFAGKDLPFYSRQVYTFGSRYQTGSWVWNLDSYAQSKQYSPGNGPTYITQESVDGQHGNIPGYMIWNIRSEYRFGPDWANLTLGAGIKNLFDQRYFTRSNDRNLGKYVGEPRTFFVQGSVSF